ncbi:zinc finger C3HC4 type domain containing protein [Nitzschia inconspicua]|uniref:Zinc finger C3HC4 type domain containing protein n=1 Tax=Nitzschia inconspicua TaxID=303405 RepID=A0A9K3M0A9_9STRA|nr:zinc finger C3HC4 type domain containing protein [Nitzschia inconspicua]
MGKKSKNRNKKKAVTGDGSDRTNNNLINQLDAAATVLALQNRILPRPNGNPIKPQPQLTDDTIVYLNSIVKDQILDKIFACGSNGPFSTKNSLREYLLKLISDPSLHIISIPVVFGLALGPPHIHKKISVHETQEEPLSLLYWACQWKFLRIMGYWPAESELIDMILKAGGIEQINNPLKNGTNPLFTAVRYADLKGVNILLDAEIKVDHRDARGISALRNAVEYPQPPIVERLLEFLPATDKIPVHNQDTGDVFYATLVELMIDQLHCANTIVPWVNLGPPSPENFMATIHLLQNKGCHFTEFGLRGLKVLQTLFRNDLDYDYELNSPALFEAVGRALVGEKLPECLQPMIVSTEEELESSIESANNCPICLDHLRKEVTLYCGHTFCVDCIIQCANDSSECPLCRSMLCPDLSFLSGSTMTVSLSNILGLSHGMERISVFKLTDEQIRMEANIQGIDTGDVPVAQLRLMLVEDERNKYTQENIPFTVNNIEKEAAFCIDLSAPINMIRGTAPCELFLAPVLGRVCIEVLVQAVPVLAFIANQNAYTVVSKAFADQFHLKQIDMLQSKNFLSTANGKRVKNSTLTCLEPFVVNVGGIEVNLRNAIVQHPSLVPMCGIHLGMDFLASAAYCPIDVKISSKEEVNVFARVEKNGAWRLTGSRQESFRFYSHDGRSAHLPLLHFSPFEDNIFLGISMAIDTKYDVCFWCCRLFPEGMVLCANCDNAGRKVTYCDSRCQKAAWRVHKRRIEMMPSCTKGESIDIKLDLFHT